MMLAKIDWTRVRSALVVVLLGLMASIATVVVGASSGQPAPTPGTVVTIQTVNSDFKKVDRNAILAGQPSGYGTKDVACPGTNPCGP